MLRCSELVYWRYEALLVDDMHMIERNKIESSAPFTLDQESVPNDGQGDILYLNLMTYNMVEDQPNG